MKICPCYKCSILSERHLLQLLTLSIYSQFMTSILKRMVELEFL